MVLLQTPRPKHRLPFVPRGHSHAASMKAEWQAHCPLSVSHWPRLEQTRPEEDCAHTRVLLILGGADNVWGVCVVGTCVAISAGGELIDVAPGSDGAALEAAASGCAGAVDASDRLCRQSAMQSAPPSPSSSSATHTPSPHRLMLGKLVGNTESNSEGPAVFSDGAGVTSGGSVCAVDGTGSAEPLGCGLLDGMALGCVVCAGVKQTCGALHFTHMCSSTGGKQRGRRDGIATSSSACRLLSRSDTACGESSVL